MPAGQRSPRPSLAPALVRMAAPWRPPARTVRGLAVGAVAVVAVATGGCSVVTQGGASAGEAPAPAPLVAVLDRPLGAVPNLVRLLHLDGTVVASAALPEGTDAVALAGRRVLVLTAGVVRGLGEDGSVAELERTAPEAGTTVTRLVGAPDGSAWLWSTVRQSQDGTVESHLMVGRPGQPAQLLLARTAIQRALVPVLWSPQGAVVSDEPVGIGGYVLFRRDFGDTSALDLATGSLAPLSPGSCALSDLGPSGVVTCVSDGHEGPHGAGPVTLEVRRGGVTLLRHPLPAPVAQAGAALVSPDGAAVTLASSPATGDSPETIEAEVIDLASGRSRPLPAGLVPVSWLSDGSLVAARRAGISDGEPGTWLVAPGRPPARISTSGETVGVAA